MKVTCEEVKKIAHLSRIAVTDEQAEHMREHVEQVLGYAVRVCEIARDLPEASASRENVLRADVVQSFDAQLIRAQAPDEQENLFVVPKIL